MFSESQNKEAAWAWIEWWMSEKGQHRLGSDLGRLPTLIQAIQDSAFLHLEPALRIELQDVLVAMNEIGRDKLDPAGNTARQPFAAELNKVWAGEQSVRQAVDASIQASRAIHEAFLAQTQK